MDTLIFILICISVIVSCLCFLFLTDCVDYLYKYLNLNEKDMINYYKEKRKNVIKRTKISGKM